MQRLLTRFAGFLTDQPLLEPGGATRRGFAHAANEYVRTGCWPAEWMRPELVLELQRVFDIPADELIAVGLPLDVAR